MSWHALCAIAMVCTVSLAALAMVLRHLAAMRITSGEVANIRDAILSSTKATESDLAGLKRQGEDFEKRLTHLNTRTAR